MNLKYFKCDCPCPHTSILNDWEISHMHENIECKFFSQFPKVRGVLVAKLNKCTCLVFRNVVFLFQPTFTFPPDFVQENSTVSVPDNYKSSATCIVIKRAFWRVHVTGEGELTISNGLAYLESLEFVLVFNP